LTVANTFAVLRLLPMTDREKDAEILVLRHQIAVLERQPQPESECGSLPRTGRCSRRCCTGCLVVYRGGCGCSYGRTR
jgi:hypothetical protein